MKWYQKLSLPIVSLFLIIVLLTTLAPQTVQAIRPSEKTCKAPFGFVYSDGKGDRVTKGLGGNSLRVTAKSIKRMNLPRDDGVRWGLAFGQGEKYLKHQGKIRYLTLHTRYKNGGWRVVYQGKLRGFGTSTLVNKYLKDSRITHLIISINGAHEKFEPIRGKAAVRYCLSGGLLKDRKVKKVTQKDINSLIGYWGRGWDTHSVHRGGNCNDQYSGSIDWTTVKGRKVLAYSSDYFGFSTLSFDGPNKIIGKGRNVYGLINNRRDIIVWYTIGKPATKNNIVMIWWKGCN